VRQLNVTRRLASERTRGVKGVNIPQTTPGPSCGAAACGFICNTTADASQIRMMRGLRTTYVTGEIRGDTLLISRLSRFSDMARDFVDEGGARRRLRKEENQKENGNIEPQRRRILYPRVRNCDTFLALSLSLSPPSLSLSLSPLCHLQRFPFEIDGKVVNAGQSWHVRESSPFSVPANDRFRAALRFADLFVVSVTIIRRRLPSGINAGFLRDFSRSGTGVFSRLNTAVSLLSCYTSEFRATR